MYRVGFGDSFLLSLPAAVDGGASPGDRHILVDCGVHAKGDIGTLGRVVDNIAEVTARRLAIVVATHAHQDHIAGFDRFADQFAKFDIAEVWLPWTWDPNNPDAVKLQKKNAALTDALAQHFAALGGARATSSEAASAAVQNLKGNAHAIALLKSGFGVGATVRYLKAGDALADPAQIAGLSVRFLGPPQSQEFLAQMDPPAGQHYLQLATSTSAGTRFQPFGSQWHALRKALPSAVQLAPRDERHLEEIASSPADELAFALDQARNNESVVTYLTYRGRSLLFPGDAQYGNWRWWLENEQPDEILSGVNFFKVAHHGSINATPKSALEKMADGHFAAMVSTQSTPWPSIPRVPLMQRLDQKTKHRIVRSDWLPIAGAPTPARNTAPQKPDTPPAGFTQGDFWFDYQLIL
jgi:beta-lactamase superfamily II metal-dependent hydrolase